MSAEPELREIGAGVFAYLQRGSWGYSNAGLIRGQRSSLLVDTLYDVHLTQQMLRQMRRVTGSAEIGSVVNTHANGDHCWGNQALDGARIISSRATAEEMLELKPSLMATLVRASRILQGSRTVRRAVELLARAGIKPAGYLAEAADLVVEAFGSFEFGAIRLRLPDTTFEGTLEVDVGGKRVQLLEVGPAHTRGDVIAYVPSERAVFTGDILFIGSHPIMWAGPVANWIAACDRILALDVDVVVPGHGPITDKAGVQQVREYWSTLLELARLGRAQGVSPDEVARQLFAKWDWSEAERLGAVPKFLSII
jgi:glyoxylase-like metal-dependent hydrolase (beta-lactamase superfamily II)